jgi:hypothetical protein
MALTIYPQIVSKDVVAQLRVTWHGEQKVQNKLAEVRPKWVAPTGGSPHIERPTLPTAEGVAFVGVGR